MYMALYTKTYDFSFAEKQIRGVNRGGKRFYPQGILEGVKEFFPSRGERKKRFVWGVRNSGLKIFLV